MGNRTVIIPDVHENIGVVENILRPNSGLEFDRVVFLGDWFDRWPTQPGDMQQTVRWLLDNIENPDYTFLWGNHDLPYCYPNRGLLCSGHDPLTKQEIIRSGLGDKMLNNFQLAATVGQYTCSHAGFASKELLESTLRLPRLPNILPYPLPDTLSVGWSRGGDKPKGGCTWMDWNEEFVDIPGFPQIVGHTKDKGPRWKGESLCIDTAMRYFAVVDGADTAEVYGMEE